MTSIKSGVVGYPVAHSLSPRVHGFWLKEHGIDGEYARYEVKPERLGDFLEHLDAIGLAGCNLTLPHKEEALNFMDELDASAKAIGAVNTVVVREGKRIGSNTDAHGFIQNLRDHVALQDYLEHAVVLGAGGAAKAVVYGLLEAGAKHITLMNRTRTKAEAIAAQFGARVDVSEWGYWEAFADASLLANTTALGMQGKEPLTLSLDALPKAALVTDIVYTPLETELLTAARTRGNVAVDGLGMLLHQAAAGFEAWFGIKPTVSKNVREATLKVMG